MTHKNNPPDLPAAGSRIRTARKQAGLSQQALAALLGVSRNTVVNWETGRCITDFRTAHALCELLGLSPDELDAADLPETSRFSSGSAVGRFDRPAASRHALSASRQSDGPAAADAGTRRFNDLTSGEQRMLQIYRSLSAQNRARAEDLLDALRRGLNPAWPGAPVSLSSSAIAGAETSAVDAELFRLFADYPGAAAVPDNEFGDTRPEPLLLRKTPGNEHANAIVRVSGDSMEPVYHDGDYLYFRFSDTARSGLDVVCSTIHGAIVKRMGDNGLFSVNPQHPFRMRVEADNVRLLGIVTGIASPEDWPSDSELRAVSPCFSDEEKDFRRKYRLENWE